MEQGYQNYPAYQSNQGYLLQDIPVNNFEDLNRNIGEVQLIAKISNKDYFCYAIKVEGIDYLMFIDNSINQDFIKSNQNIVVIEDNVPKSIQFYIDNNGFTQITIDNITASFSKYSGNLNPNNIIKYYDNYFSSVSNSVLKVYKSHLNELVKQLRILQKHPTTTMPTATVIRGNNRVKYTIIVIIVIIVIIALLIPGGEVTIGDDDDD